MKPAEIASAKKLIKDIRNKLSELERVIGQLPQKKFTTFVNHQQPAPRKKSAYREPENISK